VNTHPVQLRIDCWRPLLRESTDNGVAASEAGSPGIAFGADGSTRRGFVPGVSRRSACGLVWFGGEESMVVASAPC